MNALLTPGEIADAVLENHEIKPHWNRTGEQIAALLVEAVKMERRHGQREASRAMREREAAPVYVVQNESGDVVAVLRDGEEASAAHQFTDGGAPYSVIEQQVWERGEYATIRIAQLTEEWEEAIGDTASDYDYLSEDDWAFGLDRFAAAEITALIEWQKEAGLC
jgi:hypothetical protein